MIIYTFYTQAFMTREKTALRAVKTEKSNVFKIEQKMRKRSLETLTNSAAIIKLFSYLIFSLIQT